VLESPGLVHQLRSYYDFPRPYIIAYGSSPSRFVPELFVAPGQTWDLPVPKQRVSTHARFFDHAGPSGRSLSRAHTCRLPHSQRRRHPPPSRATAHGSRPMWLATPSSYRTCTDYSSPVSRRTAKDSVRHPVCTSSRVAR
jgi:hypothetical protein